MSSQVKNKANKERTTKRSSVAHKLRLSESSKLLAKNMDKIR